MKKFAIGLWAAQVLAAVSMLIVALVELETIIGTGPALSIIGLALAAVTHRLGTWEPMVFGLSGPLVCALIASLIAIFRWGPREAEGPVPIILAVYILAATPLAITSLRAILRWQVVTSPQQPRVWQYSMKSLLAWMTVVCVLAAGGQYLAQKVDEASGRANREAPIFAGFALAAAALSSAILWRFLANRRRPTTRRSADRIDG